MGFNGNKVKLLMKLVIERLKMLQQKKASLNEAARREIAALLEKGKTESASIKVEHIIREDYMIEALELVELYCELIVARFGLIAGPDVKGGTIECPPDLQEAVATVTYAAPRCEVEEMRKVASMLGSRFGSRFHDEAQKADCPMINGRVLAKLKVAQLPPQLVTAYLSEIARTFKLKWIAPLPKPPKHDDDSNSNDGPPSGRMGVKVPEQQRVLEPMLTSESPQGQASAPRDASSSPSAPPRYSTFAGDRGKPDNINTTQSVTQSTNTSQPSSPARESNENDLDALQRRLEALKKRDF